VYHADEFVLHENLFLQSSGSNTIAERVGNASVFGSIILVGHRTKYVRDRLSTPNKRETFEEYSSSLDCHHVRSRDRHNEAGNGSVPLVDPLVSVSNINQNVSIVRFLCDSVEDSFHLLIGLLCSDCHVNPSSGLDESITAANLFQGRLHGSNVTEGRARERISVLRVLQQYDGVREIDNERGNKRVKVV